MSGNTLSIPMFHQLATLNRPEDWLIAAAAIALWMLVFHLLRTLLLRRLAPAVSASDTRADDFLFEILSGTRFLLAAAIGLFLATRYLVLPERLETGLNRVFIALMFIQGGFWAERALRFWLKGRFKGDGGTDAESGAHAMTRSLLTFIGRVLIWALVLLLILDNIGLDVTALVASLGIGGIAVALAVQNILGDLFASLSITVDKPFVIGDFIIVDDFMGNVEHVGLKTTRLRSLGGEQLIFSNNDLLGSRIRNYKRMNERRITFGVGITYDTPPEKVEAAAALIKQAITAQDKVRFDRAHFKGFGASSLDFEAVYYVLDPDFNLYMDIQQAINLQMMRDFAAQGIEFAFPTQTVFMNGSLRVQPPEDQGRGKEKEDDDAPPALIRADA